VAGRTRSRSLEPFAGSEYEALTLRPSWGSVSIVLFFCALLLRPILIALRWRPSDPMMWPLAMALLPPLIGLAGLACGVAGLKLSRRRGSAKAGVFLNGTVVALSLLFILAVLTYRWLR